MEVDILQHSEPYYRPMSPGLCIPISGKMQQLQSNQFLKL